MKQRSSLFTVITGLIRSPSACRAERGVESVANRRAQDAVLLAGLMRRFSGLQTAVSLQAGLVSAWPSTLLLGSRTHLTVTIASIMHSHHCHTQM